LRELDAYHLAWAEYLGAEVLLTTDDAFLSRSTKLGSIIKVRVVNPITLAVELSL
jgi:hypothetical protein